MKSHWKYVPFDDLFEWKSKSSIKSGDGKSVGYYKMFICSDTETKRYDDFIESGESLVFGTGGKAACHYVNEKFAYSTDCVVAQPKTPITFSKFYYYYLRQKRLAAIQETFTGSGLQHTSKKKIGALLVPVLPYDEQKRIVAKIEELFSELDNGVETLKKTKQQLAVYRQSVLKQSFSFIEIGDYKPLKSIIIGSPQNGLYKPKTAYGSGVQILRIDSFYDGEILKDYDFKRLSLTENEVNQYKLYQYDLIINRVNSMPYLGKCALVRDLSEVTVFESNMMRLKIDFSKADPEYVTYFLTSFDGRKELTKNAKQAVNQASINQTDVCSAIIPVPGSLELQRKVVSKIKEELSVCDNLEKTIETALQQAEAMRQSILKKAFEGML